MRRVRAFLRSYWTPAGRQALGNFVGLGLGLGIGHVCAFVAIVLLTRGLGPEAFGRVSFALTVQSYLFQLGGLGAGAIMIREIARRPADADRLTSSDLLLVCVSSAVVAVGHIAVVSVLPLAADERRLHFALALGTGPLAYALIAFFDAFHRQSLSSAVLATGEVLAVMSFLVLDHQGWLALPQVGAVYAGKWAFMTLGHLAVYNGFVRRLRWAADRATVFALARSGLPVVVSSLVILLPLTSGVLLVRAFHGEAQAGVYGVATQLASGVYMVGLIGNRILHPHISGAYGLDRGFVLKLVAFEAGFLLVLMALGLVAGVLATRWFLPADYAEVPAIQGLLLAAGASILVANVAQCYLIRHHRERTMMSLNLCGAIGYVAVGLVVIPAGGTTGAAATAAVVTGATAAASVLVAVRYARHSL